MTTHPQLCATVTADTTAELRRRRDAVTDADLVELRLDTVHDPDVAGALEGRTRPAIVTCRPVWEGGRFAGAEDERLRILAEALERGAEFVDVEWRAGFAGLLARDSARIVLSSHDFDGVPDDLETRAASMRSTGAGVVKIAVTAGQLRDLLRLKALGAALTSSGRAVLIGMGERGLATRVLPGRFGSAWSYAGALSDVGQIGVATLVGQYRFRALDADTEIYGVTGWPVSHSVSPAMHNAAFGAMGRNAVYLPFPATTADDFMACADGMDLQGASVTIPHKVALLGRADEVSEAACRIGALNTLRRAGRRWLGTNTDVAGFLRPFDVRGIDLAGWRAAVLGAGGSARAVAVALASRHAQVTVHARQAPAAAEVAALCQGHAGAWPPAAGSWDLLVNCTPIGMHPRMDESPVPSSQLDGRLVYDLVYNPGATRLVRDAAVAGCGTIGGLDMLVAQAEAQCEWWTGERPPAGVMRAAAEARLAEFRVDEHHVV